MKDENLAQLKMVYDELWSDANIRKERKKREELEERISKLEEEVKKLKEQIERQD
jgi:archaellum component FlaC